VYPLKERGGGIAKSIKLGIRWMSANQLYPWWKCPRAILVALEKKKISYPHHELNADAW